MALMIAVSVVLTFSPMGSMKKSYVATVERVPAKTCEIAKKAMDKRYHVVTCIKEVK